jgi:glycosyltransferase involved in cell wall biosynthesis
MPKLTVLQMLPSLNSGGVERGTLEVSRALVQAGHDSRVMSAGGRMVSELEQAGSQHLTWAVGKKSLFTLKYISRLRHYLENNPVDILHARSRLPAWIAYLAWKKMDPATRPRFITTVHGLYSVKKYSSIMTRGEVVIAVSNTIKQYILNNYPNVDEHNIRVIYRGVDANEFPYQYTPDQLWMDKWLEQYPQLKGNKIITLPGRLTRLKGHSDFIKLMAAISKNHPHVVGLIVGPEDENRSAYAEEIRQQVNTAGLQQKMIFTGHRSDMREIYAVSDIVLSLSKQPESFGRTTLEALSLGTPVIAYNQGGVGEILNAIYPEGCVVPDDLNELISRVNDFLEISKPVPEQHTFMLQDMLSATLKLYEELATK